jgi:hypothetical protein
MGEADPRGTFYRAAGRDLIRGPYVFLRVPTADLSKVQTCTIAAVVVIPVHVEDLLTLNGQ